MQRVIVKQLMAFFEPPSVLIGVVLTTPVKMLMWGTGGVIFEINVVSDI
ncbi:hypothetical protein [Leuconostoc pseudomesenteroides]